MAEFEVACNVVIHVRNKRKKVSSKSVHLWKVQKRIHECYWETYRNLEKASLVYKTGNVQTKL